MNISVRPESRIQSIRDLSKYSGKPSETSMKIRRLADYDFDPALKPRPRRGSGVLLYADDGNIAAVQSVLAPLFPEINPSDTGALIEAYNPTATNPIIPYGFSNPDERFFFHEAMNRSRDYLRAKTADLYATSGNSFPQIAIGSVAGLTSVANMIPDLVELVSHEAGTVYGGIQDPEDAADVLRLVMSNEDSLLGMAGRKYLEAMKESPQELGKLFGEGFVDTASALVNAYRSNYENNPAGLIVDLFGLDWVFGKLFLPGGVGMASRGAKRLFSDAAEGAFYGTVKTVAGLDAAMIKTKGAAAKKAAGEGFLSDVMRKGTKVSPGVESASKRWGDVLKDVPADSANSFLARAKYATEAVSKGRMTPDEAGHLIKRAAEKFGIDHASIAETFKMDLQRFASLSNPSSPEEYSKVFMEVHGKPFHEHFTAKTVMGKKKVDLGFNIEPLLKEGVDVRDLNWQQFGKPLFAANDELFMLSLTELEAIIKPKLNNKQLLDLFKMGDNVSAEEVLKFVNHGKFAKDVAREMAEKAYLNKVIAEGDMDVISAAIMRNGEYIRRAAPAYSGIAKADQTIREVGVELKGKGVTPLKFDITEQLEAEKLLTASGTTVSEVYSKMKGRAAGLQSRYQQLKKAVQTGDDGQIASQGIRMVGEDIARVSGEIKRINEVLKPLGDKPTMNQLKNANMDADSFSRLVKRRAFYADEYEKFEQLNLFYINQPSEVGAEVARAQIPELYTQLQKALADQVAFEARTLAQVRSTDSVGTAWKSSFYQEDPVLAAGAGLVNTFRGPDKVLEWMQENTGVPFKEWFRDLEYATLASEKMYRVNWEPVFANAKQYVDPSTGKPRMFTVKERGDMSEILIERVKGSAESLKRAKELLANSSAPVRQGIEKLKELDWLRYVYFKESESFMTNPAEFVMQGAKPKYRLGDHKTLIKEDYIGIKPKDLSPGAAVKKAMRDEEKLQSGFFRVDKHGQPRVFGDPRTIDPFEIMDKQIKSSIAVQVLEPHFAKFRRIAKSFSDEKTATFEYIDKFSRVISGYPVESAIEMQVEGALRSFYKYINPGSDIPQRLARRTVGRLHKMWLGGAIGLSIPSILKQNIQKTLIMGEVGATVWSEALAASLEPAWWKKAQEAGIITGTNHLDSMAKLTSDHLGAGIKGMIPETASKSRKAFASAAEWHDYLNEKAMWAFSGLDAQNRVMAFAAGHRSVARAVENYKKTGSAKQFMYDSGIARRSVSDRDYLMRLFDGGKGKTENVATELGRMLAKETQYSYQALFRPVSAASFEMQVAHFLTTWPRGYAELWGGRYKNITRMWKEGGVEGQTAAKLAFFNLLEEVGAQSAIGIGATSMAGVNIAPWILAGPLANVSFNPPMIQAVGDLAGVGQGVLSFDVQRSKRHVLGLSKNVARTIVPGFNQFSRMGKAMSNEYRTQGGQAINVGKPMDLRLKQILGTRPDMDSMRRYRDYYSEQKKTSLTNLRRGAVSGLRGADKL